MLALLVTAIVVAALAGFLATRALGRAIAARRRRPRRPAVAAQAFDPGRERRAELRARELLRSCLNEDEWAMYRDLGFVSIPGRALPDGDRSPSYAYLVYPHKPVVAYAPATGRLLSEYCVEFPDLDAGGRTRLPPSDDVLAKWMALTSDEARVIGSANMHLVGRQHDPARLRRDLWRLAEWQRCAAGARAA